MVATTKFCATSRTATSKYVTGTLAEDTEQPQLNNQWRNIQNSKAIPAFRDIPGISTTLSGFGLPRKVWCTLNRMRTGHGNCADFASNVTVVRRGKQSSIVATDCSLTG